VYILYVTSAIVMLSKFNLLENVTYITQDLLIDK